MNDGITSLQASLIAWLESVFNLSFGYPNYLDNILLAYAIGCLALIILVVWPLWSHRRIKRQIRMRKRLQMTN